MKKLLATTAFVLMTLGGVMANQAGQTGGSDAAAKALVDLEFQWQAASKANDGDALGKLLADGLVVLDADGTTRTKAQVVERTKKSKLTTNELSDVKATAHGDTGVVTGIWTGKGVDGSGKTIDTKERWVDTWAKIGGKWQCVASASATLK